VHHRRQHGLFGLRAVDRWGSYANATSLLSGDWLFATNWPKARAARGIGDQMYSLMAAGIFYSMQTPIVEQPSFAGGHVYGLVAAKKRTSGSVTMGMCSRTRLNQ